MRFVDFKVLNDGQKSVVIIRKLEVLDELHGFKPGTSGFAQATRIKAAPFCTLIMSDVALGALAAEAAAIATYITTSAVLSWITTPETAIQ